MRQSLTVPPGKKIRLKDFDPDYTGGIKNKKKAKEELEENVKVLADLGYRLYAENRRSLLLVLQGMDTAGKDGTIRHVMRGFNPQSCQVTSFKQPGIEELNHDFLWRIARAVPRKGNIGIFNRSHYEDVLVTRVHKLVPKAVWSKRYDLINSFEKLLTRSGTRILKFYLHISKEEQLARFKQRIDDPVRAVFDQVRAIHQDHTRVSFACGGDFAGAILNRFKIFRRTGRSRPLRVHEDFFQRAEAFTLGNRKDFHLFQIKRLGKRFHTSQISTPCLSEARASGRFGTNSWATKPLKPVSTIALITAG